MMESHLNWFIFRVPSVCQSKFLCKIPYYLPKDRYVIINRSKTKCKPCHNVYLAQNKLNLKLINVWQIKIRFMLHIPLFVCPYNVLIHGSSHIFYWLTDLEHQRLYLQSRRRSHSQNNMVTHQIFRGIVQQTAILN